MDKDPKSPATTSAAYDAMCPLWDKVNTLLMGTDAMRAAGETYLPRHPKETQKAYDERRNTATLLNMLQFTLDCWTGKPFRKALGRGDDVPEAIKSLLDNIDLQGNNIDVFARRWFRDGVSKGFSHVLVEYPRVLPRPDGMPRTLADDNAEGVRPYLVHILPENLIFAYATVVQGKEVLQQIRIHECETVLNGFAETVVEKIRLIEPGLVTIYEKRMNKKSKKVQWVQIDQYTYDLKYIPLVTFYADREGFMMAKPPLSDLADLNIRHFQSTSDQIAVLTVARFPILAVSGVIAEDNLVVGPNQWINTSDPASRVYYVEHTGAAINAGRTDLVDLEEQMAQYGATFLRKRPGGASATAHAIDNAEVTSPLQDMAIRFHDSLNQAMMFFAEWMKLPSGGSYTVETDFGLNAGDKSDLDALTSAREMGDIAAEEYLTELKRLGVLSENFDIQENIANAKAEQKAKADQAQKLAEQTATNAAKVAAANKPTEPAAPKPQGGAANK